MLTELRVKNLALIARAELELGPGLTVLSGETGAGKTALISSLKLLIGERGDSTMVGAGADEASVEALFCDDSDAEERLVIRKINTEGRSRCYLDDSLVTVGELARTLGPAVDLYGQHEHQSLLKVAEQLCLLDEYAGAELALVLGSYQKALALYEDARAELQRLLELAGSSNTQREQAAFLKKEIEKAAPRPGEYELLELEIPRLSHGEQLAQASGDILELLRGEDGVLERLSAAAKQLAALRDIDAALQGPSAQLEGHLLELEELAGDLGRYGSGIEFDPEALQVALDRLGVLDGLSRRFGPGMDQVFAQLEQAQQLLLSAEDTAERIAEAEGELALADAELRSAAAALSLVRQAAALEFVTQLGSDFSSLALTGASLEFSLEDLPFDRWGASGSQSFELLYRPAPDASAKPLAKIASGGELSRVMLAIKGLLQSTQKRMTLVFDEIDAGIGGKTAHAVAERLARLATVHQVLVITHLAQIAVLADQHFLVDKSIEGGTTRTTIMSLSKGERVKEVARMLSGSSDAEAMAHAQKMLDEAGR